MKFLINWALNLFSKPENEVPATWPFPTAPVMAKRKKRAVKKTITAPKNETAKKAATKRKKAGV